MKALNILLSAAIITIVMSAEASAQQSPEWVDLEDVEDISALVTLPENAWWLGAPTFLCRLRLSSEALLPGTLQMDYTDCTVPDLQVGSDGVPSFESFKILQAQSYNWISFQGSLPNKAIVVGNLRGQNLYACLSEMGNVGFYAEGASGCQSVDTDAVLITTQIYQQFSILIGD